MDNYPPGSDNDQAPFNQKSPTDAQLEYADHQVLHETDSYPEWMISWTPVREPCTYFGLISNPELFILQMNAKSTPEVVFEASKELRKRFFSNSNVSEEVNQTIQSIME